jgi:hypothetical protein
MMLYAGAAGAVAYCALRDPASEIQRLFPASTTFRTLVGTVTRAVRPVLEDRLPFDIHFDEFGRHSLYAVFEDGRPVGFVHARSELGQWGMDEIVWALDLDLRIVDFTFQRTRDPASRSLEDGAFKARLRGLDFDGLAALHEMIQSGRDADIGITPPTLPVAVSLVRSAMKVQLMTEAVWAQDVAHIRALDIAARDFPRMNSLDSVAVPYSPAVLESLDAMQVPAEAFLDRESLRSFRVVGESGDVIGLIINTRVHMPAGTEDLWWTLSRAGRVMEVRARGGWSTDTARHSFGRLDRSVEELQNCATPGEVALLEVLLLARGIDN